MTRWSTSIALLALFVAGVSCKGIREVPTPRSGTVTEPSFAGSLDSASSADFSSWAARQEYSRFVGDSQRLAQRAPGAAPGPGGLRYGPMAWIYPVRGLGDFADTNFVRGRIIARIHADGEYRKLGLRVGENYLIVRRVPGGGWRAMMRYPGSDSVTYLDVEYESHPVEGEGPPETVRWLWSDDDEDIWGRCSAGCCKVIGFREGGG